MQNLLVNLKSSIDLIEDFFSEEDYREYCDCATTIIQLFNKYKMDKQKNPKTSLEQVQHFHKVFDVKREQTDNVEEFKISKLRFSLLLEEVIELGAALGISQFDRGMIFSILNSQVTKKNIPVCKEEVADALGDIQFLTDGSFDVFNLGDKKDSICTEIYESNMSKAIPKNDTTDSVVAKTIEFYENENIKVNIKDAGDYFVVINSETNKILKSIEYKPVNLNEILNK